MLLTRVVYQLGDSIDGVAVASTPLGFAFLLLIREQLQYSLGVVELTRTAHQIVVIL